MHTFPYAFYNLVFTTFPLVYTCSSVSSNLEDYCKSWVQRDSFCSITIIVHFEVLESSQYLCIDSILLKVIEWKALNTEMDIWDYACTHLVWRFCPTFSANKCIHIPIRHFKSNLFFFSIDHDPPTMTF